jgi:hypothetical protein
VGDLGGRHAARRQDAHARGRRPCERRGRASRAGAAADRRFARVVGRDRIVAGTDCGLGSRVGHPEIAWAKLESLVDGPGWPLRPHAGSDLGDLPHTDVLIDGDKIAAVGKDLPVSPHANVIDARIAS